MSIAEKLQTIAENEQKVYEAGKQAEYDSFWDNFGYDANTGKCSVLAYFFCGDGWNFENFKPKYDLVVINPVNVFYMARNLNGDLEAHLNSLGVKLDFSSVGATNFNNTFEMCTRITKLPDIDFTKATTINYFFRGCSSLETFGNLNAPNCEALNYTFRDCISLQYIGTVNVPQAKSFAQTFTNCSKLKTIEKIIISDTYSVGLGTAFGTLPALVNFDIEGIIKDDFTMAQSNYLSANSVKSIISHLYNYSGTSYQGTRTLSLSSSAWNNLEANSPRDDGITWREYVNTKLGWLT